jgi:hypothetical protein
MYENGNTVESAAPSQSQHSELEAGINESNFIQGRDRGGCLDLVE